jgi:predicted DNA-binding transcriptional regulator
MRNQEFLTSLLLKIGLSTDDSKIYLLCFEYGALGISTIARLLKTPRTTINDRVEKLVGERILIPEKATHGHKYYCANAQELINILSQKNQKIFEVIDEIKQKKELWDTFDYSYSKLPKIKFYEGDEVFKNFANKMKDVNEAAFIEDIDATLRYTNLSLPDLVKEYFLGKKKHIREIVFDSPQGRKYAQMMNRLGANVRLWVRNKNAEQIGGNSDIGLMKNYYYHITYGEVIT